MSSRKIELITQSEAAELRGMTLAAVNEHVRNGRWRSETKFGKRLVYRDDVIQFEPKTHKSKHQHPTKKKRELRTKRGGTRRSKQGKNP
jgi:hypothetical protein